MTAIGPLLAATIVTDDLGRSRAAYQRGLGLDVVAGGRIDKATASLWDLPAMAGADWSLLASDPGGVGGLRLIEVEGPAPQIPPLGSLGWAAAELSVIDPEGLQPKLEEAGFRVIGPPRPLGSNRSVRAMQVAGPSGEVLYLTDVRAYDGALDLHRARRRVDRLFIAVLACHDLEDARGFYEARFAADRISDRPVDVPVLRKCLNLSDDALIRISSLQISGGCLIEHDQYPETAHERPTIAGLPSGIAMMTVRAEDVEGPMIDGPPYGGAPVALVRGRQGELIELVGALA